MSHVKSVSPELTHAEFLSVLLALNTLVEGYPPTYNEDDLEAALEKFKEIYKRIKVATK